MDCFTTVHGRSGRCRRDGRSRGYAGARRAESAGMTANLPEIIAGSPIESGHITAFPLYVRDRGPTIDYRLGVDAMVDGVVTLGEIARGHVSSIRARNASERRVLFVDGDHLLGARQNRAVISSTVIGPRQEVDLPVCCVEQGRWHAVGERFRPAP